MVQVSNFEEELDRVSGVCPSGLVIVRIDDSLKDEEEEMALNQRKGLKDLLVGRKKESASTDAPGSQPLPAFPPPPSPPIIGLLPIPNLKKKRKEKETEEGEVVHRRTISSKK